MIWPDDVRTAVILPDKRFTAAAETATSAAAAPAGSSITLPVPSLMNEETELICTVVSSAGLAARAFIHHRQIATTTTDPSTRDQRSWSGHVSAAAGRICLMGSGFEHSDPGGILVTTHTSI